MLDLSLLVNLLETIFVIMYMLLTIAVIIITYYVENKNLQKSLRHIKIQKNFFICCTLLSVLISICLFVSKEHILGILFLVLMLINIYCINIFRKNFKKIETDIENQILNEIAEDLEKDE